MIVFSLNYHEITEDPRVFKQARSLTDLGHDVTVFCDLKPGFPEEETLHGVRIRRFAWRDLAEVNAEGLAHLRGFARSYPIVEERLERILELLNLRDKLVKTLRDAHLLTENLALSLESGNLFGHSDHRTRPKYKNYRGLRRVIEKVRYKAKVGFAKREFMKHEPVRRALSQVLERGVKVDAKSGLLLERVIRKEALRLYQAEAFLFDLNLQKLNFSETPDIVHAHDIYTLAAGASLASRFGAKLVYDAHEYEIERASKMPPEGNALAIALEEDCLEHAAALVTVSEGLRQLYQERFPRLRTGVVMNSPDISMASFVDSTEGSRRPPGCVRTQIGLDADVPIVAFTGWVQRSHRGLDKVAEAISLLPGYHLAILGPRHERDDASLSEQCAALGVLDRVHLLDPVPHQDVVGAISSADVSVIPFQDATLSYRHAMPNKLFEAAFAGLPISVANLPDMRRFVEELGIGRAMDQTDPQSIASNIQHLYTNKEKYRLSDAAKQRMVNEFSWAAQVRNLNDIYRELGGEAPEDAGTRVPDAPRSVASNGSRHMTAEVGHHEDRGRRD
jgi:glycosyltransferase involved in cell wall biosynthesis